MSKYFLGVFCHFSTFFDFFRQGWSNPVMFHTDTLSQTIPVKQKNSKSQPDHWASSSGHFVSDGKLQQEWSSWNPSPISMRYRSLLQYLSFNYYQLLKYKVINSVLCSSGNYQIHHKKPSSSRWDSRIKGERNQRHRLHQEEQELVQQVEGLVQQVAEGLEHPEDQQLVQGQSRRQDERNCHACPR